MPDAFYLPDGDRFASTGLTRGPWDDESQRAGPPAALLARALQRCGEPGDRRIARVTVDILGPVPIAPLTVSAEVVRPGRRVELVDSGDRFPRGQTPRSPPPGPAEGSPAPRFPSGAEEGWHTATCPSTWGVCPAGSGCALTPSPCPSPTGSGSRRARCTTKRAGSAWPPRPS